MHTSFTETLTQLLTEIFYFREKPMIVPYRDSKLTRMFQSYFNGHGKACMVVNVNQCASMFDETLHALKYSAIAKQVRTFLP